MACRRRKAAESTRLIVTAIMIIASLLLLTIKVKKDEKISYAPALYIFLCCAFFLILLHQAEQPAWAVSSLGNLALRMCHRSVLFARNPQWTFFTAVNTTWQDFIGMLLKADTPLGTFLSQVSSGTNASLLRFAPPWAKFGSSCSVCLLPLILHTFGLLPVSDYFLILSEGREEKSSWLRGRERGGGGRGGWIKQTEVCVYQVFHSWHTDPGSVDDLRSVGTVWSREARGHWTPISCRKGRIIRELERIFRNRWEDGGGMCGREREGGREGGREAVSLNVSVS